MDMTGRRMRANGLRRRSVTGLACGARARSGGSLIHAWLTITKRSFHTKRVTLAELTDGLTHWSDGTGEFQ
jgi:hypothetical protein